MHITYSPIGVIRTPYATVNGMPIQPVGAVGVPGTIEVFGPFRQGLSDLVRGSGPEREATRGGRTFPQGRM